MDTVLLLYVLGVKAVKYPALIEIIKKSDKFKHIENALLNVGHPVLVYGLEGTLKHLFMGLSRQELNKPLLIVTHSEDKAREIAKDLRTVYGMETVRYFPARELLPVEVYAHSRDVVASRIEVMKNIIEGRVQFVAASIEALIRVLPPPVRLKDLFVKYSQGNRIDRESLLKFLVLIGYERVDIVEIPGQFAVRGGIIDIFPITDNYPVRVELFDDEIDTIRDFDPETQISKQNLHDFSIDPAVEFPYAVNEGFIQECKDILSKDLYETKVILSEQGSKTALDKIEDKVGALIEEIEANSLSMSFQQLLPLFLDSKYTILDYFVEKPEVVIDELSKVKETALKRERELRESFQSLLNEGGALITQKGLLVDYEYLYGRLKDLNTANFALIAGESGAERVSKSVQVNGRTLEEYRGKAKLLIEEMKHWKKQKYVVVIMTSSQQRGKRIKDNLWDNDIEAVYMPDMSSGVSGGQVIVTIGQLTGGFEFPSEKLVVITDRELYGRSKLGKTRRSGQKGMRVTDFTDIKPGDFVVHVHHGIGKYLGIINLEVQGVKKDYLHIQYAGEDSLYVPTEQIEFIQKYVGAEGHTPRLNKLGSAEWSKAKAKVKSSVQELAKELLNLYAARAAVKGHAFSPDTEWQAEFEEAFPFNETPDQLQAIKEVKADMEDVKVMDRLLIGDVGYGKTEVALRAAFKAIMDNKQVAVLVPTTVLAHQHYQTFEHRFGDFPIKIGVLSRLRRIKEQKAVIKGAKRGNIDIVIGTHRILSKDIVFKDLGLLIVDEEQRFGVAHKEKLKQLKKNVDVLTLTATPIPRTLHMALAGARDMSVIDTPPEDRYPVQTYVVEYSREIAIEAIRNELNRGGQIYYVNNRIKNLERRVTELRDLIPGCVIEMAHGQLPERELENIMTEFIEGKIDVLVSTTIVENGLDISNVNTLIVEEADNFGLSQLYQLRGRVGRTNRVAYAYFTYRRNAQLNEVAEKRLNAISEFTEFGSGFKLAMRDLEIRGAGNLLGPEQHGHMLAVGFDLYCQLLEESVAELKQEEDKEGEKNKENQEKRKERTDVEMELAVNAYLKEDFIGEPKLKFEMYNRLSEIESLKELSEFQEEVEDRFGFPPEAVKNLFSLTRLRVMSENLGIKKIREEKDKVIIKFSDRVEIKGEALLDLVKEFPGKLHFSSVGGLEIEYIKVETKGRQLLQQLNQLLEKIEESHINHNR